MIKLRLLHGGQGDLLGSLSHRRKPVFSAHMEVANSMSRVSSRRPIAWEQYCDSISLAWSRPGSDPSQEPFGVACLIDKNRTAERRPLSTLSLQAEFSTAAWERKPCRPHRATETPSRTPPTGGDALPSNPGHGKGRSRGSSKRTPLG